MLVTPGRKYLTLALGSGVLPGDPYDVPDAKHLKLANLTRGLVFVGESAADELEDPPQLGGSVNTATCVAMPR